MVVLKGVDRHFKFHVVRAQGVEYATNCIAEARKVRIRFADSRLWRTSPHDEAEIGFNFPDVCLEMCIHGPCPPCPVAVRCGCMLLTGSI